LKPGAISTFDDIGSTVARGRTTSPARAESNSEKV
jgi:hypothetical protein